MPPVIPHGLKLVLGFVMGFVFGVLLDKGRLNRYEVIVNFFRLRDGRLIKVMFSAIVVGAAGVYLFYDLGWVNLHLKDTLLVANIVGGAVMGVGMVMLGYCPGTSVAAAGVGSIHAMVGIAGGLAGVALFAELYPALEGTLLTWGSRGKETLPGLFQVNHWVVIALLVPFVAMLLGIIELVERLQYYRKAARRKSEEALEKR